MVSTRASSSLSSSTGRDLNGTDALQISNHTERRGIQLYRSHRDFAIDFEPDSAGFYVCSNKTLGVVKLGKADGGVDRGLSRRLLSLGYYWKDDVHVHVLRTFKSSVFDKRPKSYQTRSPFLEVQHPRKFAAKFELAVKRKLRRGVFREFFDITELPNVLRAVREVIRENSGR